MWALNASAIRSGEALQVLARYKEVNGFQSNLWILPLHLMLLGVRAHYPAQLLLPAAGLLPGPPRAVPFSLLPSSTQRCVLNEFPPPMMPPGHFAFLERTPAAARWRAASMDECFDAAFMHSEAIKGHTHLLCEANFTERLAVPEEVAVLNAQETSNPFLIDPFLCHRCLVSGDVFSVSISSALTTIASQFHYTSFDWVENSTVGGAGLRVREAATPHLVNCLDSFNVVHVSQLPMERQEELVSSIPRYALLKSPKQSFFYFHSEWRSQYSLELSTRLQRCDIPCEDGSGEPPVELLLWVVVTSKDVFSGPAKECVRLIRRKFYNAQQLC